MNFSKNNDNSISTTKSALLNSEVADKRLTEVDGIVIDRNGGPVAGQMVELYKGSKALGIPVATATTDADGCYSLLHIGEALTYSVRVVPPLPAGATAVTPDPAVISHQSDGVVAAGIFVIH